MESKVFPDIHLHAIPAFPFRYPFLYNLFSPMCSSSRDRPVGMLIHPLHKNRGQNINCHVLYDKLRKGRYYNCPDLLDNSVIDLYGCMWSIVIILCIIPDFIVKIRIIYIPPYRFAVSLPFQCVSFC